MKCVIWVMISNDLNWLPTSMTIFSVLVDKQSQFLYLKSYINCYLPVELEYFCSTSSSAIQSFIKYRTILYNTVQYCTILYNTVQFKKYCTVLYIYCTVSHSVQYLCNIFIQLLYVLMYNIDLFKVQNFFKIDKLNCT